MSELQGQTNIGDYLPDEKPVAAVAEGYDAEGKLLDYVPTKAFPHGEGGSAEALTDEVDLPKLPADVTAAERLTAIAAEVRTIEEQVRGVALSGAVAIGRRLIEAKGLVPYGRFLEWIKANLDYSERRAQDLMRLYETYGRGTIPESVSALDYSKAVALLAAPEEARESLAERAADEGMSVRRLQEEIRQLNEARKADQVSLEQLEARRMEEADTARRAIERMEQDVSAMRGTAEAANRTADALRRERDVAQKNADAAAKRASDAVSRANETQAQLSEAQRKIGELEAREPERVEVVPPEVAEELEKLRRAAGKGDLLVRFRMELEHLTAQFTRVRDVAQEIEREDAERGRNALKAVGTLCEKMIGMLGVQA